ncbi:hypothetical protein N7468_004792 [Penicillium chermesinum]|uniref:Uncharacterized protein n=1 Tax=Penicillium chermesinum TaxID=63820 RepID=A0A9W9TTK7_9EURO|nr:uncharacterized protein N7468_004792 [Penicillium chermesinum]KAJ5240173.1 hypothetical protein N7468_004792 [Penicillium chermesinum]KAJ6167045.1 hypothetical protein N7470_002492 [Penicillium chermesinum]
MTDSEARIYHGIPNIPGSKSASDESMKKRQNSEKQRQQRPETDGQSQATEGDRVADRDTDGPQTRPPQDKIVSDKETPAHNSEMVSDMLHQNNSHDDGGC